MQRFGAIFRQHGRGNFRSSTEVITTGAVCVHHARVKENVTLAALESQVPQLRGRTGAICTEDFARQNGAILLNWSVDWGGAGGGNRTLVASLEG